jgi:DNA-binding MarR family transcriptional regulator
MAAPQQKPLVRLIEAIRDCARRMQDAATDINRRHGISDAQRTVIDMLARQGAETVPAMARMRSVSRQHIQTLVDGLAAQGLVELQDNPAHKRSPLVDLSDGGKRLAAAIAGDEQEIARRLVGALPASAMTETTRALEILAENLDEAGH